MNFKKQYEKIMNSKLKYVVLLALVGILFILFSTFSTKKEQNTKSEVKNVYKPITAEEYSKNLEIKLNNIISKIKGVGKSEVFITIENGVENIYANSEKKIVDENENFSGKINKRNDTQKDFVVIDGDKGKQALVITQKEPKIKGVLVVCEGGDDVIVVENVINAISKSLNIKKNRLSVVKSAN